MFAKLVKDAGKQNEWNIDSGAIGNWHVGKGPDRRAISVLTKHSISTSHKARQVYYLVVFFVQTSCQKSFTFPDQE